MKEAGLKNILLTIPSLRVSRFGVSQKNTNLESNVLSWIYLARRTIASTMASQGSLFRRSI